MKKVKFCLIQLLLFANVSIGFNQNPEVIVSTGHNNLIQNISLSATGNFLASNSSNHIIKIWDISSGREICTLNNNSDSIPGEERIMDMIFSQDSKYLYSQDENGKIIKWNLSKEKPELIWVDASFTTKKNMDLIADCFVFISQSYKLKIQKPNKDLHELPINNLCKSVIFNKSNNNQLIYVTFDNRIFLYNIEKQINICEFEKDDFQIWNIDITYDGKYFMATSNSGNIQIWNVQTGKKLYQKHKKIQINHTCFLPLKHEIVILENNPESYQKSLSTYNIKNFTKVNFLDSMPVFSAYFSISADSKFMAINNCIANPSSLHQSIDILSLPSGKKIKTLQGLGSSVMQIVTSPVSPKFASLGKDLVLRIWNIGTQQIEKSILSVVKISHSQGSNQFATYGFSYEFLSWAIMIWDFDSLKCLKTLPLPEMISDLWISKDGLHVAAVTFSGFVKIWNIEQKEEICSFKHTLEGFGKIAISNDLQTIAIGDLGISDVGIFDFKGNQIAEISHVHLGMGVSDLSFTPDNKYLVTSGFDKKICYYETDTWLFVKSYSENIGPVSDISFSQNLPFVISGTAGSTVSISDYAVHCWNNQTFQNVCKLLGHSQTVNTVEFFYSKKYILSGSDDGKIKIWSIDSCKEIVSCIPIGTEDYIFVTPDNYYTGSKDALLGVGFKMSGIELFPFEQFDLMLNRPDIIAERLGVASIELIDAFRKAYEKRLKKMGFQQTKFENDFHLPQVTILNADQIPFSITQNELKLIISANDNKHLIDRIFVWINNIPVFGAAGIDVRSQKTNTLKKELKLKLSSGENKIQVSVLNQHGVESLKQTVFTVAPSLQKKNDLYIVSIGVSDYHNDNYDLEFAAKDAKDILNLYKDKHHIFNKIYTHEIIDLNAVKENILKSKDFLQNATVDDMVIIFVAGHGILDQNYTYYFGTTDIDAAKPSIRGIAYDELESILDGINPRKKILIVDACHSGEVDFEIYPAFVNNVDSTSNVVSRNINLNTGRGNIGLNNSFVLMKEIFAELRRGTGAVVISSAGGSELAYESSKYKNGVFTYALLEGLSELKADLNHDSKIQISELRNYITNRVYTLTRGMQTPTMRRENIEFDYRIW